MTTYRTAYSGTFRLRIDIDVPFQMENVSRVRTRFYLESTGGNTGIVAWKSFAGPMESGGSKTITSFAALTLLFEDEYTIPHNEDGSGRRLDVYGQIEHFFATGGGYPLQKVTGSFTPPKINRLPSAPPAITFTQSLAGVIATCEKATPAVDGAAPVLEYQVEHVVVGEVWPGTLAKMSGLVGVVPPQGMLGTTVKFRARARSIAGWGPWSADWRVTVLKFLGYRMEDGGVARTVQHAERYLGGGKWTPVTVAERSQSATAWVDTNA